MILGHYDVPRQLRDVAHVLPVPLGDYDLGNCNFRTRRQRIACSLVCVVHLGPLENVGACIHKLSGTTKDASERMSSDQGVKPEACLAHPSGDQGRRASPAGNDRSSHSSEASLVVPLNLWMQEMLVGAVLLGLLR